MWPMRVSRGGVHCKWKLSTCVHLYLPLFHHERERFRKTFLKRRNLYYVAEFRILCILTRILDKEPERWTEPLKACFEQKNLRQMWRPPGRDRRNIKFCTNSTIRFILSYLCNQIRTQVGTTPVKMKLTIEIYQVLTYYTNLRTDA
jgi:hypothetical protein